MRQRREQEISKARWKARKISEAKEWEERERIRERERESREKTRKEFDDEDKETMDGGRCKKYKY